MINTILSAYAQQMEQYISSFIQQPEGMVEVGIAGGQGEEEPCKIQLFLLSVERETATGIVTGKGSTSGRFSGVSFPPLYANLNIVIASVFSPKRYKESLSYLSLAITFLQSTPVFTTGDGMRYTIHYRIRSLDKIPLQDHYQQIELVLWEKLLLNDVAKEHVLLRAIPFPDLSMNPGAAKDTVWKILYF